VSEKQPARPQDILWLAVWCGLITACIALSTTLITLLARRASPPPMGLDAGWLNAPLVDAGFFGAAGLILYAPATYFTRLISFRTAAFVLVLLSAFSLLYLVPGLAWYSMALLALGFAARVCQVIDARRTNVVHFCRASVPWLLALAVGLAAWDALAPWAAEQRARRGLPPASPGAPNVLVIVLDTVRAQTLSVYGHSEPTSPWLERFAQSGVLFEHAISTAPWTLPSHATLFTGRFPGEHSADWVTSLDATFPTLAELFSARGYQTAAFVANYDMAGAQTGLDRGFHRYDDHNLSKALAGHVYIGRARTSSSFGRITPGLTRQIVDKLAHEDAAEISREFLNWLARREDRPVFAFLNFFDSHSPYLCPDTYKTKFRSGDRSKRRLEWYKGCTAYLDNQLGMLFGELRKNGFLKNAVVIITSDHGEQLGEHGLVEHGHTLYREVLEVPLIIASPRIEPRGMRVKDVISMGDVAATIVDLAGIKNIGEVPGASLARHWLLDRRETLDLKPVFSHVSTAIRLPGWPNSDGPMISVVENGLHYIKSYGQNREELYDFTNDPRETSDLVNSPEGATWLPHLRARIAATAIVRSLR